MQMGWIMTSPDEGHTQVPMHASHEMDCAMRPAGMQSPIDNTGKYLGGNHAKDHTGDKRKDPPG
jgi:hypothetical protein